MHIFLILFIASVLSLWFICYSAGGGYSYYQNGGLTPTGQLRTDPVNIGNVFAGMNRTDVQEDPEFGVGTAKFYKNVSDPEGTAEGKAYDLYMSPDAATKFATIAGGGHIQPEHGDVVRININNDAPSGADGAIPWSKCTASGLCPYGYTCSSDNDCVYTGPMPSMCGMDKTDIAECPPGSMCPNGSGIRRCTHSQ